MEASSQSPDAQPAFTITRQDHSSSFDPNDPNGTQWTIYFRTPSGVDSQITVSDADYTPENVSRLITAKVAQIEAVAQLGQPGY